MVANSHYCNAPGHSNLHHVLTAYYEQIYWVAKPCHSHQLQEEESKALNRHTIREATVPSIAQGTKCQGHFKFSKRIYVHKGVCPVDSAQTHTTVTG